MNLNEALVQKAISQLANTITEANQRQEAATAEATERVVKALQEREGDFSDEITMIESIGQAVKDANERQVSALRNIAPEVSATLEQTSPSESTVTKSETGSGSVAGAESTDKAETGFSPDTASSGSVTTDTKKTGLDEAPGNTAATDETDE